MNTATTRGNIYAQYSNERKLLLLGAMCLAAVLLALVVPASAYAEASQTLGDAAASSANPASKGTVSSSVDSTPKEAAESSEKVLQPQEDLIASGITGTCSWKITTAGELILYPTNGVSGMLENYYMYGTKVTNPWWYYYGDVTKVTVKPGVKANRYASIFGELWEATSIDLSGLDTSYATDLSYMFYDCFDLTSVNLTGLNTSNVTTMSGMFENCHGLKSINMAGLNTSKVTDMSRMFPCKSLTYLNVSGWNTSRVKDMSWMFGLAESLQTVDISGFNTSSVTTMEDMFTSCKALRYVDVSGFDTSNVTSMMTMFLDCGSLTNVDVSRFNTSKVWTMGSMFGNCTSLQAIDVSGFNTSNLTSCGGMFGGCESLTSVDVSHFNTSKLTGCSGMFSGCTHLTSLDLSNFRVSGDGMLDSCDRLMILKVGSQFDFNFTMPTPSSSYISGATGRWISSNEGNTYTADFISRSRDHIADTYVAQISGTDISKAAVVGLYSTYRYTGSQIKPVPSVILYEKLTPGVDFTVSYSNNVNVGSTASVTVTGQGSYAGQSKTVYFKIIRATSTRLWGLGALDTGAKIVQAGWSNNSGGTVVIATDGGYWDALSACGLAGLSSSPVILTNGGGLSAQSQSEIKRLGATSAIIVGGKGAITDTVERQIHAAGVVNVTRLWGISAPDTARAIYEGKTGWSKTCVIATADGFQDALAAAPYCYAKHAPMFLTEQGTADQHVLSYKTLSAIKKGGFTRVIIVGGEYAVSLQVEAQLKGIGISNYSRLAGNSAYDTCQQIDTWAIGQGMTAKYMGLATGEMYYDALCGAALCGKNNSILVLASNTDSTVINGAAASNRSSVYRPYVFGGSGVVSGSMMYKLETALG